MRTNLLIRVLIGSIHFSAVACIKDFYKLIRIINRVYNSVVAYSDAIIWGIMKFFGAGRLWLIFKKNDFLQDTVSNMRAKFFKLPFSAGNYFYTVTHLCGFSLRSSLSKFLSGLELSLERLFAIVMSMMSSLRFLSSIRTDKNTLFSCLGRALNAVRNTSAVARSAVIFKPSFSFNVKYTLLRRLCQAILIKDKSPLPFMGEGKGEGEICISQNEPT